MTEKKKSMWSWLNPMTWIDGFFRLLGAIFGPVLRLFGLMPPPDTESFDDLSSDDVADAAKLAAEEQAAVEELQKELSPAEIVRAYARANAADRVRMDLSSLGFDQQHWLLNLSDDDLALLGMSTTSGCARSLERKEVLPIYAKQPETEPLEILAIPSVEDIARMKRDFITARFNELFFAPGVPNPNPKVSPTPTTLH